MKGGSYILLVERAQDGDTVAFGRLVQDFQDFAAGTAYGWLGDAEATRDVAQEAFLDAYLHLDQLRDPASFPGWLRRIVIKHCDRITRRRKPPTASLDDVPESVSPAGDPKRMAEVTEQADRLRFAVEGLPALERQVVALHYFAEATGPELAEFLELPLPTIKKRLRTARSRLRDDGERLMQKTMDGLRPSRTGSLTRDVMFFIALRAGDREEVARLLAITPELVDARQDWESELVLEGVLPFANKATALITAIEQDDSAMLDLLLEAGADVNGLCGCDTGESPLWASILLNRPSHARRLLERGADPNLRSATGNYPLHLAAMRGRGELADVLLAHGADPALLDAGPRYPRPWSPADDGSSEVGGRTAAEWAEANGHGVLAEKLRKAGRVKPERSGELAGDQPLALTNDTVFHTGIKGIDLFVPLLRGGLIRVPFKAGVGMVVLLGELCHRFCAADDGEAIWTGFTQPPFDLSDWEADMAEFGLRDRVRHALVSFKASPEERRDAFQRGIHMAEDLRDDGREVLAVVLTTSGFESDVEANLLRLAERSEHGSITTLVVTAFPESGDVWEQLTAPYAGQITLDRKRAQKHLFPALDPGTSLSGALSSPAFDERHVRIAAEARSLLAAHLAKDPDYTVLETGAADVACDDDGRRAAGLLRYLCQPFFTTEPFTGRQGEWVARDVLLDDVERLLTDQAGGDGLR